MLFGPAAHRSTFRILYVCTGNLCRSPFAEILTRHLLSKRLEDQGTAFDVASAGVQAVVGAGMHPYSRDELAPWNLHMEVADRFVARQLDPEMLVTAGLVLGMTASHRAAVIDEVPRTLATAFSVREFARLSAQVPQSGLPTHPAERAREVVRQARLFRSASAPRDVRADDVPDPIGQPREVHHDVAVMVQAAVTTIVAVVAPPGGKVGARSAG
jgi:protein-tyrosine phosphatase